MAALIFCVSETASGRLELIAGAPCLADEFPQRALTIANMLGMTICEKIDGWDELLWIATIGKDTFCISWDHWLAEVSIMSWGNTSDEELWSLVSNSPAGR